MLWSRVCRQLCYSLGRVISCVMVPGVSSAVLRSGARATVSHFMDLGGICSSGEVISPALWCLMFLQVHALKE
ncbi:hypothetical protein GDO81_021901 [Engystomops pustulosus]|uniref:Secreted protein n=1 Tax=Engystomops pustulosus TaxID=76066 RepID=A0AAV6ZSE9_ENGPU|nr:hypothetical protein GDO81_021901 [Engystomops pustulosus]